MRITGWYIDGFGHFCGWHQTALADGLTVVYGPNEAGKTTLLAFIRSVLFGFPSGRSSPLTFVPQRGGQHGGRLYLAEKGHRYALSRMAGPNGGEAQLIRNDRDAIATSDLLGAADRTVFENVFAFGLDELHDISSLQKEAVRERIFSGGILGTGQSAQEVMRILETRQKSLLAPRARDARIPVLLERLHQTRGRLARAVEVSRGYAGSLQRESELTARIERLRLELQDSERRISELEILKAVWQDWYDAEQLSKQIAMLPPLDELPQDVKERLADIMQRLRSAQEHMENARRRRDDTLIEIERLQEDNDALAIEADVSSAVEQRAVATQWNDNASVSRSQAAAHTTTLASLLGRLGPGWDDARVAAFDRSIARAEEIRACEDAIQRARLDSESAATRVRMAQDAYDAAERQFTSASEKLHSYPVLDSIELERRGTALAELAERLQKRESEQLALASDERALADARETLEFVLRGSDAKNRSTPRLVLAIAGAALVVYGAWRFLLGESSGIAAAVMGVVIVLAALMRLRGADSSMAELTNRVERASRARDDRQIRLQNIGADIAQLTKALTLETTPRIDGLDRLRQELAKDHGTLQRREEIATQVRELRLELDRAEARRGEEIAAATDAARTLADAEARWLAWKRDASLPVDMSPKGVLDLLETVKDAQQAVRDRDSAISLASNNEGRIAVYLELVNMIAAQLQLQPVSDVSGTGSVLARAADRCGRARTERDRRALLDSALASQNEDLALAERRATAVGIELDALCREAAAPSDIELERNIALAEQRARLSTERDGHARAVALRLGTGDRIDALKAELSSANPVGWAQELAMLREACETMKAARDDIIREQHDAFNARTALEQAADVPSIELEISTLEAELASAVREWRVLTMARHLVESTLARFERERQPAVLARAGQLFAHVTNGAYPRLRQHEREILVIDSSSGERDSAFLSRGTREQLYLCIRLGLCHELSQHRTALPLVMDDVLVNFDGERAAAVGRLLVDVAREQQVLLFTCHERIRDLFASLDPSVEILELERYTGAGRPATIPVRTVKREMPTAQNGGAPVRLVGSKELSEAAKALLEALVEAAHPLGKKRLLEMSGVDGDEWPRAIGELITRGTVMSEGQKRGAVYRLADADWDLLHEAEVAADGAGG